MTKIDILFDVDELISVVEDNTQILKISALEGAELTAYQNFIVMLNSKQHIEYNQIMITDYCVKRYVLIFQKHLMLEAMEEVLYDDLSNEEKNIFDNFYNTFTE